jgi:two-component system sensor histidine kinase AlgZ
MERHSTIRRFGMAILNLSGISLLAVLFLFIMVGGIGSPRRWEVLLSAMKGTFPISFCIGGLSWLVMPGVAARYSSRPGYVRWPIYGAVMTVTATAGTMLVWAIYFYGSDPASGEGFPRLFEALQTSIPITWVIGGIITLIGTATARLQHAELALRTHQLEKERTEKLVAEAQFASLASRIQPHFLFNTLNSIAELTRQQPAEAEALIERLASLLRSSLAETPTVSLEQELKLVRDYLEIQRARFGDRLRYEVSPHDIDATVPPFAIQTLVENSLKHVAAQRPEGVTLCVRASRSAGDLLVEVSDNGPGFQEDALKAGHGLDNLQSRLRALYGDSAGLEFLRLTSGMTVRLRVPVS